MTAERETEAERWSRRARGWHFLSRVVARGVTPETLPLLRAVTPARLHPHDQDQAAARHHAIFGLNVPAREGLFLEAGGRLTEDAHNRLLRAYLRGGYQPPDINLADALEVQMAYLAALCRSRAAVQERDAVPRAGLIERFLGDHLLRWIAPCCEAVARQGDAIYAAVALLMLELAAEHAAALHMPPAQPLPPAPDLLADPATRLDDIAARLAAPVQSGFLLDRATLRNTARALELPAPLADRPAMLAGLLRAAGEFSALPAMLAALDAHTEAAAQAYAAMLRDLPALAPWVTPWQARCQETHAFLGAMHAAYSSV